MSWVNAACRRRRIWTLSACGVPLLQKPRTPRCDEAKRTTASWAKLGCAGYRLRTRSWLASMETGVTTAPASRLRCLHLVRLARADLSFASSCVPVRSCPLGSHLAVAAAALLCESAAPRARWPHVAGCDSARRLKTRRSKPTSFTSARQIFDVHQSTEKLGKHHH